MTERNGHYHWKNDKISEYEYREQTFYHLKISLDRVEVIFKHGNSLGYREGFCISMESAYSR